MYNNKHILIMQRKSAIECENKIKPIPYNIKKYMAFKLEIRIPLLYK
jgi:hypothetical protein